MECVVTHQRLSIGCEDGRNGVPRGEVCVCGGRETISARGEGVEWRGGG